MNRNIKKLIFILFMIIYSTVYYLEVRNLGHFEDRILITAVFWFLLVFAVIEVIKNIKNFF